MILQSLTEFATMYLFINVATLLSTIPRSTNADHKCIRVSNCAPAAHAMQLQEAVLGSHLMLKGR